MSARAARWLAFSVLGLGLALACSPSLIGKDRCRSDRDCASPRLCLGGLCGGPSVRSEIADGGAGAPGGSAADGGDSGGAVVGPGDGVGGAGVGADGSEDSVASANQFYVAPHPDAALLFMNPDLMRGIQANRSVRVVFLTSGEDQGGLLAAETMEARVREAHAAMASAGNDWTCVSASYVAKTVQSCVLRARPSLNLIFLRIPDGHVASLWARDVGPDIDVPAETSVMTVDGASRYSRDDLIQVLAQLMAEVAPGLVGAPNGTTTFGIDHEDAIGAGAFTLAASHRYAGAHTLRAYRGYNVFQNWDMVPQPEDTNLSQLEHDAKAQIVSFVDGPVASADPLLDQWCWRQYANQEVPPGAGRLGASAGPCLVANGGALAAGDCALPAATRWTLSADHRIGGEGGACLAASEDGVSVVLAACADDPRQRWTLMDDGQLQGPDAACLTLGGDLRSLSLGLCGSDRSGPRFAVPLSQRWTLQR